MRATIDGNTYRLHGDNLPDVMRYLSSTPRVWEVDESENYVGSHSWDLGAGWDGTLELCRTGWSKGGQDMRLVLSQLGKVSRPLVKRQYNMEAGEFHMGRYLTGDPFCFKAKVKKHVDQKPTISFAVNISANCNITAQSLANCGAAIAQAVKQYEAIGNKVEVIVYDASSMSGSKRIVNSWLVKRADGKLDMAALAFSIAHPAAMRRVSFGLMERAPLQFGNKNYGAATELLKSDLLKPGGIIFNTCVNANELCATPEKAVESIQAVLKAYK